MSNTQEPTETAEEVETTEYKPDPEWQALFDLEAAAWKELGAYFNWPDHHQDEESEEAGEEAEAVVAESSAGEAGINSKDSPLNPAIQHSAAFFDLYLARRPGDLANEAARMAFSLYFNCPNSIDRADAAAARIGDDLDALAAVAQTYISIYSFERDEAAGDALGEQLLERLGSDERRAGLLLSMAESWMWNGQYPKARQACERIIAANAAEHDVKQAKGMIYEMDNLNVGNVAPAFEATDIDGNPIRLAGLRGKVVLIDFWATWCGPCRGEFPHLRRVHEKFAGERFVVLSISLDEDCDEARKMIEKEKLAWVHVCEGQWHGSRIAELYNVMGIPSTWLVGPDGRIAAKDLRGHHADKVIAELLGVSEDAAPAD
jgi:peroxiredoxin